MEELEGLWSQYESLYDGASELEQLYADADAEAAPESNAPPNRKRRRMNYWTRFRPDWKDDFYDFLSPLEFRQKFGLTHAAFDHVHGLIRLKIVYVKPRRGGARNGVPLPTELKLQASSVCICDFPATSLRGSFARESSSPG